MIWSRDLNSGKEREAAFVSGMCLLLAPVKIRLQLAQSRASERRPLHVSVETC